MDQSNDLLILVAMIIGVGSIFFVLSRVGLNLMIRRAEQKPAPDLAAFFDADTASHNPLLIYFFSNSCKACTQVSPLVDKLSSEYANITKVNCSEDRNTASAFAIMGVPTLILVKDGVIAKMLVGGTTEQHLRNLLDAQVTDS